MLQGGLWDCSVQGAAGVYVTYKLLSGEKIEVGTPFEIPGIPGQFNVVLNKLQSGEMYEREK